MSLYSNVNPSPAIRLDHARVPVLLLDGGMGTTLENLGHDDISKSPLWSASVIEKDPQTIVKAHLAFLDAGADVIITNTYVLAFVRHCSI